MIIGTMRWGSWGKDLSVSEAAKLIEQCVSAGLTTFDLADIYGDYSTEKLFGEAFALTGIDRTHVRLISKCGIVLPGVTENHIKRYNLSADYIIQSAVRSMQNLQTYYLDTLLIHRPSPLMDFNEIACAYHYLTSTQQVLCFGASNFDYAQFDMLSKYIPLVTNQIEISLSHLNAFHDDTLLQCQHYQIQPMAWSPLGSIHESKSKKNRKLVAHLKKLESRYQATTNQLIFAWLYKSPAGIQPIIGSTKFKRIAEVKDAANLNMSDEDWFELYEIAMGQEVA